MDTKILIEKLIKRGFKASFCQTKEDAVDKILNLIDKSQSVGFGGSATLEALQLPQLLFNRGNLVFHHKIHPQDVDVYREAGKCDWYLSSANAITQNGEIVNIDGRSNRISSLVFGPQNTLIVLGINKITENLEQAIWRVRNVAAPPNAVRLNKKTPCAITGKCSDCYCDDCMCNNTLIQHHPSRGMNTYVVIINEQLGF